MKKEKNSDKKKLDSDVYLCNNMLIPFGILGIAATVAVAIFVIIFVYLVTKWAIKRTKEISKRFEYEAKDLESKEAKLREIEDRISSLRTQYNQVVTKGDLKTGNTLSKEIKRLEKERNKLSKKIQEY